MIPKKILITGASSGVGRSLANFLSKEFHVIVVARRLKRLKSYYGDNDRFSIYKVDLGNDDEVGRFITRLKGDHGYIPYLINNAAVNKQGELLNMPVEEVTYSSRVNAFSPLRIMQGLLPEMRKQNFGRVINITSGAPLNCFPGFGTYSASKGLLNALTVTIAKEHTEFNIKINLMSPGPVRSEMSPDSELEPEICHPTAKYLLQLGEKDQTGKFFWLGYEVPLFPDLEGVNWLEGKGNEKMKKVL